MEPELASHLFTTDQFTLWVEVNSLDVELDATTKYFPLSSSGFLCISFYKVVSVDIDNEQWKIWPQIEPSWSVLIEIKTFIHEKRVPDFDTSLIVSNFDIFHSFTGEFLSRTHWPQHVLGSSSCYCNHHHRRRHHYQHYHYHIVILNPGAIFVTDINRSTGVKQGVTNICIYY